MAGKSKAVTELKTVTAPIKSFFKTGSLRSVRAKLNKASKTALIFELPDKNAKRIKKKRTTAATSEPSRSEEPFCLDVEFAKKKHKTAKFPTVIPKSHAKSPRYFFNGNIPAAYNESYMHALPRDPQCLFVYWEIPESVLTDLKQKMGDDAFRTAKKILRVRDVADDATQFAFTEHYTDFEINGYSSNWYINVPESGRTYIVECGYLTSTGMFFSAVRSNVVKLPRSGPSPVFDQNWTTVDSHELMHMPAHGFPVSLGASENRFVQNKKESEAGERSYMPWNGSGVGMIV